MCFTANSRRHHFDRRFWAVGADRDEMAEALDRFLADEQTRADGKPGPITFLFSGQGSQYLRMGETLYRDETNFRRALDHCFALFEAEGVELRGTLFGDDEARLTRTLYAQPALFSLQVALAELWRGWGVTPDTVIGHSIGEFAAAVTAGTCSVEDAARLVATRARLMEDLPERGAMASIGASLEQVRAWWPDPGDRIGDRGGERARSHRGFGQRRSGRGARRTMPPAGAAGSAAKDLARLSFAADGADARRVHRGSGRHLLCRAENSLDLDLYWHGDGGSAGRRLLARPDSPSGPFSPGDRGGDVDCGHVSRDRPRGDPRRARPPVCAAARRLAFFADRTGPGLAQPLRGPRCPLSAGADDPLADGRTGRWPTRQSADLPVRARTVLDRAISRRYARGWKRVAASSAAAASAVGRAARRRGGELRGATGLRPARVPRRSPCLRPCGAADRGNLGRGAGGSGARRFLAADDPRLRL